MKKKVFILVFLLYSLIILFTFGGLTKTFFQQDEWATFGNIIYAKEAGSTWLERLMPLSGFSHFLPFPRIIPKIIFDFFGIDFLAYALLPIIFQVISSFLVFYLAWLLTKKKNKKNAVSLKKREITRKNRPPKKSLKRFGFSR